MAMKCVKLYAFFPPYRCLSSWVAGMGSDAWLRKNPTVVTEIGACMCVCSQAHMHVSMSLRRI